MKKSILIMMAAILGISSAAYSKDGYSSETEFPMSMLKLSDMDVYSPKSQDPFLMHLAVQYRSFANYETYVMKDYGSGERFAQKGIAAYSGVKVPPENPGQWQIETNEVVGLASAYDALVSLLRQNVDQRFPVLMAEAQAKFDCWVEQSSENDNNDHIRECRARYYAAMTKIQEGLDSTCGGEQQCAKKNKTASLKVKDNPTVSTPNIDAWPDTAHLIYMNNVGWRSETPITIYHKIELDGRGIDSRDLEEVKQEIRELKALYYELKEQIARLPKAAAAPQDEVVRITIENEASPEQSQEFEILFDFDKSSVRPEYSEVLKTVAQMTGQDVVFCVKGFTDTAGSKKYNYDLGLRRAEQVKKFITDNGGNADNICTKSYGETNLKVKTPDNTPKQENRRVVITAEE